MGSHVIARKPVPDVPERLTEVLKASLKRQRLLGLVCNINPRDLKTIKPGQWLNTNVTNFYLRYMIENTPDIALDSFRTFIMSSFVYNYIENGNFVPADNLSSISPGMILGGAFSFSRELLSHMYT